MLKKVMAVCMTAMALLIAGLVAPTATAQASDIYSTQWRKINYGTNDSITTGVQVAWESQPDGTGVRVYQVNVGSTVFNCYNELGDPAYRGIIATTYDTGFSVSPWQANWGSESCIFNKNPTAADGPDNGPTEFVFTMTPQKTNGSYNHTFQWWWTLRNDGTSTFHGVNTLD